MYHGMYVMTWRGEFTAIKHHVPAHQRWCSTPILQSGGFLSCSLQKSTTGRRNLLCRESMMLRRLRAGTCGVPTRWWRCHTRLLTTDQTTTAQSSSSSTAQPSTLAQHADHLFCDVSSFGEVVPPISVTTTYHCNSHRLDKEDFVYARDGNPTVRKAEAIVGQFERGEACLYASGQAATYSALTHYKPRRVLINGGYHGTHHAIDQLMDLGVVQEKLVLPDDLRDHQFCDGDLVWVESPRNPNCAITDIAEARSIMDRSGTDAKIVVDSTLAPPPLQRCLELGAHAVMHSSTK